MKINSKQIISGFAQKILNEAKFDFKNPAKVDTKISNAVDKALKEFKSHVSKYATMFESVATLEKTTAEINKDFEAGKIRFDSAITKFGSTFTSVLNKKPCAYIVRNSDLQECVIIVNTNLKDAGCKVRYESAKQTIDFDAKHWDLNYEFANLDEITIDKMPPLSFVDVAASCGFDENDDDAAFIEEFSNCGPTPGKLNGEEVIKFLAQNGHENLIKDKSFIERLAICSVIMNYTGKLVHIVFDEKTTGEAVKEKKDQNEAVNEEVKEDEVLNQATAKDPIYIYHERCNNRGKCFKKLVSFASGKKEDVFNYFGTYVKNASNVNAFIKKYNKEREENSYDGTYDFIEIPSQEELEKYKKDKSVEKIEK